MPLPDAGVLPGDACLEVSLYDDGVGVPAGKDALLPLLPGVKAWQLKPGKYSLRGTYTVAAIHAWPRDAWVGQFELPPLEIVVE